MTKLEEQLALAKEGGFQEVVIPVKEAESLLELAQKNGWPLMDYGTHSAMQLPKK